MMNFIVIPILALLAATAVTVARIKNLWAAVMFTGIYSFLGASWMLLWAIARPVRTVKFPVTSFSGNG